MNDMVRAIKRGDGMQKTPPGRTPHSALPGGPPAVPPIAKGWTALRARAAAANSFQFNPHTPPAPHRGGSDSIDSAS